MFFLDSASAVISALLPRELLSEADAEQLADLYLDLVTSNSTTEQVKVGAGLSKTVVVSKSALDVESRVAWAKLLSSKGLRFNMELKKALVRKAQFEKVAAFLKEVNPELDLASVKKPNELPNQLLSSGLVDAAAANWLSSELSVLMSLEKI